MAFWDARQWASELKFARKFYCKGSKRRVVIDAKRQTRRLRRREWKWKGEADENS